MGDDTSIGGPGRGFPGTRVSAVIEIRSADEAVRRRAFDDLVRAYWKPAYHHVRLKWRRPVEDAKDLVQGFFARALEKEWFAAFDPARARFRTWLRTCLDGFAANELKAEGREKRGGGKAPLALDFESEEGEVARHEPAGGDDVGKAFDDAWVKGLFRAAVDVLRDECAARGRDVHFRLFERTDLDPPPEGRPTYEALAREHGLSVSDVTNRLYLVRREFRRIVLERLRAITATDEEYREEARALLGLDPS